jgi:palmitoyltransferase
MLCCYTSYFLACWVDPGTMNKDTDKKCHLEAVKRFKYDGIMFEKKNKCKTCCLDKPARSKHCGMCKACVEKFDHHCVWIN